MSMFLILTGSNILHSYIIHCVYIFTFRDLNNGASLALV